MDMSTSGNPGRSICLSYIHTEPEPRQVHCSGYPSHYYTRYVMHCATLLLTGPGRSTRFFARFISGHISFRPKNSERYAGCSTTDKAKSCPSTKLCVKSTSCLTYGISWRLDPRYTVLTASRPKYRKDAYLYWINRDGSSCNANRVMYLLWQRRSTSQSRGRTEQGKCQDNHAHSRGCYTYGPHFSTCEVTVY